MLRVNLKRAMEEYRRIYGEPVTYESLAKATRLSRATLESLASRERYNTTLRTVDRLCNALRCTPFDLLEFSPDHPGIERADEDQ